MKPDCLQKVTPVDPALYVRMPDGSLRLKNEHDRFIALGPIAERHGKFPKGTVLPETQVRACPRVKASDFPAGWLKQNHIDALEQNQKISSCCRHPENHEVEAFRSHRDEPAADIYVFHCTCGRKHRFFCVGLGDERPMWLAS